MSGLRKVAAVVVVLLGVGALLLVLRSCSSQDGDGSDPAPDASASASVTAPPERAKISTTKIEQSIKTRLDRNAGQATRVECPDRVNQKIGNTFDCDVFFDDQPGTAAVARAVVKISGPDGAFEWTSEPASGE